MHVRPAGFWSAKTEQSSGLEVCLGIWAPIEIKNCIYNEVAAKSSVENVPRPWRCPKRIIRPRTLVKAGAHSYNKNYPPMDL